MLLTFRIEKYNFNKKVLHLFIYFLFHCFSVNLWPLYIHPHMTMDLFSITIATTTSVCFLFFLLLSFIFLTFHLDTWTKDTEDDDGEATGEKRRKHSPSICDHLINSRSFYVVFGHFYILTIYAFFFLPGDCNFFLFVYFVFHPKL